MSKSKTVEIDKEGYNDLSNKNKIKKHHNIKKNIGRLVALIIVIAMLLASSATLIYYLMWYLGQ